MNKQISYGHVRLCLTNACPNQCSRCYRRHMDKQRNSMFMSEKVAIDSLVFIYSQLPRSAGFYIVPWGGEPFLNWAVFKKLIESFPQIKFQTNTSGELVDDEKVDFLLKCDNVEIIWSLLNSYEKYGSIENKIKAQPAMLRYMLHKQGIINFTVTNYQHILTDYYTIKNYGLTNIAVQPLLGEIIADEDLKLYTDQLLELFIREKNDQPNFVEKSNFWKKECGLKFSSNNYCTSGIEKLLIDPDGGIWQCDGFYMNRDNQLGDIYSGFDVNKLKNQIELNNHKDIEYCKECDIKDVCPNAKCWATNKLKTGSYFTPYPGFCKIQKAMIEMFKQYKVRMTNV